MHELWTNTVTEKRKLTRQEVNSLIGRYEDKFADANCSEHGGYDYVQCGSAKDTGKTFKTREEAAKYLDSLRNDAIDNDTSYFCYYTAKQSSKYVSLLQKCTDAQKKYDDYLKAHSIKNHKSTTIGCPKCGSKLAIKYMKSEICPLCNTDLRSKTTLDTLKKYKNNIYDLKTQLSTEEKDMQNKATKRANDAIHTMVLVEYNAHC